jgi:hypothetical protein
VAIAAPVRAISMIEGWYARAVSRYRAGEPRLVREKRRTFAPRPVRQILLGLNNGYAGRMALFTWAFAAEG